MKATFIFVRALTFAALFIGFFLVFLPARLLTRSGITPPAATGPLQVIGLVICPAGVVVSLWCVATFAIVGRGTPAPFDPPRRLVTRGPYGIVRNPMYVGAVLALAGAALYFESTNLAGYAVGFLVVAHVFVLAYEEPTLRRLFGQEYADYCRRVGRWWPRVTAAPV